MESTQVKDYPIISADPSVQAHYEFCRSQGTSDTLARMFAEQRGPTIHTDDTYLATFGANGSQFANDPIRGNHYKRVAESNGQSTTGKIYLHQLARFPGDPQAWVSGRGDIKNTLSRRGHGIEADDPGLRLTAVQKEPDPPKPLADDIVEFIDKVKTANNPSLKKVPKQERREAIVEKHGKRKK